MAELSYEPTQWVDEDDNPDGFPIKYLEAANLNHIEEGIKAVTDEVNGITYVDKHWAKVEVPAEAYYKEFSGTDEGGAPTVEGKTCVGVMVVNWSEVRPMGPFYVAKDYFVAPGGTYITSLWLRYLFI